MVLKDLTIGEHTVNEKHGTVYKSAVWFVSQSCGDGLWSGSVYAVIFKAAEIPYISERTSSPIIHNFNGLKKSQHNKIIVLRAKTEIITSDLEYIFVTAAEDETLLLSTCFSFSFFPAIKVFLKKRKKAKNETVSLCS